uniref:Superkiller viralicidic activity 2-like 2 n=1 Tax=Macrostomum lignano TaxID=282301 RepID=A0A1I8GFM1_9PLAT
MSTDPFGVDFAELTGAYGGSSAEPGGTSATASAPSKRRRLDSEEAGAASADLSRAERLLQQFTASTAAVKSEQSAVSQNAAEVSAAVGSEDPAANDDGEEQPQVVVHKIQTQSVDCTHEVVVPPGIEYDPAKRPAESKTPAKTYKFKLDSFQREAITCIELGQSVLVSAHTSAGKTVVAEYAIALSLRERQRVIYTTPIKALSNQKYREFFDEFHDVGLMTGDVTINPNASCLIMTTEILRSMLYRGSEVMREVGWVVFDEIHYMRDSERGVVWEETIILLPDAVHHVFLSATIPNARQFAEWVCALHRQPCHVVYTDYRPTPLQHYMFPCGGDGLHLVVDQEGNFREENFGQVMASLAKAGGNSQSDMANRGRRGGFKSAETHCMTIVKVIMERSLEPVIVFSFSKKECEIYALQMAKLDFNTAQEKALVEEVFNNATGGLSEEDRKLPQVESVLPLLRKGIGIHHGGLLPLLKETIEILFHEGLIKCLFATETFAMGLNMPARTVLFTSARKFDGKNYRWISSGEYIQMSGRAGRRGLDDQGTVILMVDETMGHATAKNIIKGSPDPLNSAFHLTYNMILNLLRVEDINPEYMLERSFHQFQNYASIPQLLQRIRELRSGIAECRVEDEEGVASYQQIRQHLKSLNEQMWAVIRQPKYILAFLQEGRLVQVRTEQHDFGWGVVVGVSKKQHDNRVLNPEPYYVVDALLRVAPNSAREKHVSLIRPAPEGEPCDFEVVPIKLELLYGISAVRLHVPTDLRLEVNRRAVLQSVGAVFQHFKTGPPPLDPLKDMKIREEKFADLVAKRDAFNERLENHWLADSDRLPKLLEQLEAKSALQAQLTEAQSELAQRRALLQLEELKCRKRVLRRLGFATQSDIIELKGRVACEIDSADELVLTELLFSGALNDLTAQQVAALLSCFIFEEKASELPDLSEELAVPLRALQDTARRVARVSTECKVPLDEEAYCESFKPHMMDIVAAWSSGASFAKICSKTDIFEGSIIRCMRRLEELLRQMCNAAKAIGNAELENKFAEAIVSIKRDIVFAASLYL